MFHIAISLRMWYKLSYLYCIESFLNYYRKEAQKRAIHGGLSPAYYIRGSPGISSSPSPSTSNFGSYSPMTVAGVSPLRPPLYAGDGSVSPAYPYQVQAKDPVSPAYPFPAQSETVMGPPTSSSSKAKKHKKKKHKRKKSGKGNQINLNYFVLNCLIFVFNIFSPILT